MHQITWYVPKNYQTTLRLMGLLWICIVLINISCLPDILWIKHNYGQITSDSIEKEFFCFS